jgi:hypothetical protein
MDIRSKIYAHRGLWGESVMQNSLESILLALDKGFSVETDIRDFAGELRVSHDPATEESPGWLELLASLEVLQRDLQNQTFALNIKSDGLIPLFRKTGFLNSPHFFFDLSVPEGQKYNAEGLPLATRLSEHEIQTASYATNPLAFWLDGFQEDWYIDAPIIESLMVSNPDVPIVLVSPELHGRDFSRAWGWFKDMYRGGRNISICTDHPFKVEEFLIGSS